MVHLESTWIQVDYACQFGCAPSQKKSTWTPGGRRKITWTPVESTWNMWGKVKSSKDTHSKCNSIISFGNACASYRNIHIYILNNLVTIHSWVLLIVYHYVLINFLVCKTLACLNVIYFNNIMWCWCASLKRVSHHTCKTWLLAWMSLEYNNTYQSYKSWGCR